MYQDCRVVENRMVTQGFWRMRLEVGGIAREARPGQFIMLKCWEGSTPFFMRPFSINNADGDAGTLDLLYKVVGTGTRMMTGLACDTQVKVLGPLGHGFPLDSCAVQGDIRRVALVGRGVGAAPMRYLAKAALQKGAQVFVYLSASKAEYLFDEAYYIEMGCEVRSTTDGERLITADFEEDLKTLKFDAAYVCGSKRLMRDIYRLRKQYGFAGYVSLEEHMACGVGACKGCVCSVKDESGEARYANVCKEGPVFPIDRICT